MIFNKKHAKIQSEIALETIENENFRRCAALSSKKYVKRYQFDIQKRREAANFFSGVFKKSSRVREKVQGWIGILKKFKGEKVQGWKNPRFHPGTTSWCNMSLQLHFHPSEPENTPLEKHKKSTFKKHAY